MRIFAALLALLLAAPIASAAGIDSGLVRSLIGDWDRFDELEAMGPGVLPVLAGLYEGAAVDEQVEIARTFYRLGWESTEAREALLPDLHTSHERLRLAVQWALGRVSGDEDVVPLLLDIMRHDGNTLFRDKAACALAYDQIHITEEQKVRLYASLIDSLEDSKAQVRAIALQALGIHTGQTKGFNPHAPPAERAAVVRAWRRWLAEYERNL